ncbi:glycosyltransferase [Shewanella psychropiezotolerans]|uniref:Glycosyltransferase n=1 Tax=Shewanella psychropiezotolerans TaxID=2593655 RepID=A0ABX5WXH1_9GAMM|nr:glycosyltransferase [Shewanella psychropiezotolerans]QDO83506.1 glycosyltransferase [Shewanella psychropiezotolerans]
MIKKILYVAFKYESGIKSNGLALNYKAWHDNFIDLGYEVDAIFYDDYSIDEIQKEIIIKAEKYKPDLIFFILQKDQVKVSTINHLHMKGFFTVNFFGDDQWRFESFTSVYAPYFSACITTDKFSVEKYISIGQPNIICSQWASLENKIEIDNNDYKYNVSFVGGCNRYRKWFVDTLRKRGITVDCFGNGWPNGRVTYAKIEEIFLSSKINLNISNSSSFDIRYLFSSFKAMLLGIKAVFISGKSSSQTKARNFEIPVQGGFQLTDYVPSLEDYFLIGKEISCYNSIDESEKLIHYFLNNEEEREVIKSSGIKKARNNHTFKHRIVDFMIKLEELKKNDC